MTGLTFDLTQMSVRDCYKLVCGIVVPRPIALVTSVDAAGRVNAAPFSFFNVFSDEPVQIVLGLQHKADGSLKDTTRNLAQAKYFVVNMVDEALAPTMNDCAIDFPSHIGEVEALGLSVLPGMSVPVPRLADAPFALECRKTVSLAFSASRQLLVAEVLRVHARPGLIDPVTLYTDAHVYRPIGRIAGFQYCRQGEVFDMPRQSYAEWAAKRG
jgi:flavin reductase (DIM6/NTAB) family NADH-FMN oxidoreductase RutF